MDMHDPISQHQTAVAGPPAERGELKVAGTEPRTPKTEIAYDTVDHLVNSLRSSFSNLVQEIQLPWIIPACSQSALAYAHHRLGWLP
jgi:hypothetical protein